MLFTNSKEIETNLQPMSETCFFGFPPTVNIYNYDRSKTNDKVYWLEKPTYFSDGIKHSQISLFYLFTSICI